MTDIFSHQYPESPGYARRSETSREAATRLTDRDIIHDKILKILKITPAGMTVDEMKPRIEVALDREFDRSTIAARFTELKAKALIVETDERRQTPRGRSALVYKLK